MGSNMFALGHQLKIFNTIVSLVTVNVVHDFFVRQRAAKMLLHDITMLAYLLIIYPNVNIAAAIYGSFLALVNNLALSRAEVSFRYNFTLGPGELYAALFTRQTDASLFGLVGKVALAGTKLAGTVCNAAFHGKDCIAILARQRCALAGVFALKVTKIAGLVDVPVLTLRLLAAMVTGNSNQHAYLQLKTPFAGVAGVLAEGTRKPNKRRRKQYIVAVAGCQSVFPQHVELYHILEVRARLNAYLFGLHQRASVL